MLLYPRCPPDLETPPARRFLTCDACMLRLPAATCSVNFAGVHSGRAARPCSASAKARGRTVAARSGVALCARARSRHADGGVTRQGMHEREYLRRVDRVRRCHRGLGTDRFALLRCGDRDREASVALGPCSRVALFLLSDWLASPVADEAHTHTFACLLVQMMHVVVYYLWIPQVPSTCHDDEALERQINRMICGECWPNAWSGNDYTQSSGSAAYRASATVSPVPTELWGSFQLSAALGLNTDHTSR